MKYSLRAIHRSRPLLHIVKRMAKRRIHTVPNSDPDHLVRSASLMAALASVWRLQILEVLQTREVSVTELNMRLPMSQSSLSQHLAVLRTAKLVSTRKEAQTVFYSIRSPEVQLLLVGLAEIVKRIGTLI